MHVRPNTSTILPRDQAVVWLTRTGRAPPTNVRSRTETLLDDEELRRYRSFRFSDDARLYLDAHVLLRTTLSRYANVPPADWRFVRGSHGRPEIAAGRSDPLGLRFNLSHTPGLAACAVTNRVAVGVDVEQLDRPVRPLALADHNFSRREARALRALPPNLQRVRFLEYWTLKEAYIKACGGGLSIPLDGFSLDRDAGGCWRIEFAAPHDGVPSDWQFALYRPTSDHLLAVAVHRPGRFDLSIDIRETGECEIGERAETHA